MCPAGAAWPDILWPAGFALYAMYRTDVFSRFARHVRFALVSGLSRVYPYPQASTPCVGTASYFSLGDKESRTRNPVLKNVRENTEAIQAYYQRQGIRSVFQLYPGNHYNHAVQRTADGIAWLVKQ